MHAAIMTAVALAVAIGLLAGGCKNPAGPGKKVTVITAITAVAVSITAPVKDAAPVTAAPAAGTGYTCGAVSWDPDHNPFQSGTAYTATVTLTADDGFSFAQEITAKINNHDANVTGNTEEAVTLSFTFAATNTKTVSGITVKTQPTNLTYTHGQTLDLAGFTVTLIYEDETFEDVEAANFSSKGMSANLANGVTLSHAVHDGERVVVSYGSLTVTTSTNTLTVAKADPAITWPAAATITYGQTLADAVFTGGSGDGVFAFTNSTAAPAVADSGTAYEVTFTPDVITNYNTLTRDVEITVNKAGQNIEWPQGLTALYGQTLSEISLASYTNNNTGAFSWVTPGDPVGIMGIRSHNMTFTPNDVNYRTVTNDVTVSVSLGMEVKMVLVEGGSFQMGKYLGTAYGTDVGTAYDVTPVHTVTLSSFYMGQYEITQAQYAVVMGSLPSEINAGISGDYPVYYISWYDTLVFCNKLSIAEGLTPAYRINNSTNPSAWGDIPSSADPYDRDPAWDAAEIVSGSTGYRLPTEAQWEYAAKGGNPAAAGWEGYTFAGSDTATDVSWSYGEGGGVHLVGTKNPNGLGLYDMTGNIFELCWDWLGDYPSGAQTNPTGASSGDYRVARGGFWNTPVSSQNRDHYVIPVSPGYNFGFRVVRPSL